MKVLFGKTLLGKTVLKPIGVVGVICASLLVGCQSTGGSSAQTESAPKVYVPSRPASAEKGNNIALNAMVKRLILRYYKSSLDTLTPLANNPESVEQAFSRLLYNLDSIGLVLTDEEKKAFESRYRDLFVYPLNLSPKEAQDFYTEYRAKENLAIDEMKIWLAEKGPDVLKNAPKNALNLISVDDGDLIDDRRAAYLTYKLIAINAFTGSPSDTLRIVEAQLDDHKSQSDRLDFSNIGIFIEALLPQSVTGVRYISEEAYAQTTLPPTPHIGATLVQQPACYSVTSITTKSTLDTGLMPLDCIVGVTKAGKFTAMGTSHINQVQGLLTGKRGETVTLHALRNRGGNITFHDIPVSLQLDAPVDLTDSEDGIHTQGLDLSMQNVDGKRVAYIWMAYFQDGIAEATSDFLDANHPELVVFDLRSNTGGALSELSDLAGLFLGDEDFGSFYDAFGRTQRVSSETSKVFEGNIIVLTDAQTSSGGEMLAAAIQSSPQSTVIGKQTSGTPQVMQFRSLNHIYDLYDEKLGYMSYPVQEFRRLDGSRISEGVLPDTFWESELLKQSPYTLPYKTPADVENDLRDVIRLSGFSQ
ncbi:phage tail protein [Enterovibrio norvegicus]|uniref:S41 family peptidase n=1 Tax=Enterovibrio norvegicus TaxID=188144 RepID=UPI000310E222|nr:S41 family peptidase [Enterovibrio norvegicus]OEF49183.1 phage tail protein [Enterovibrio norvegicus]